MLHGVEDNLGDILLTEEDRALRDVVMERWRQINDEGYDAIHDSEHGREQLAVAGAMYVMLPIISVAMTKDDAVTFLSRFWRFEPESFKPKTRRKDLVRAAALIIAEIDRIDRDNNDYRTGPLPDQKESKA